MHDHSSIPPAQGLWSPQQEHDSCGVGFVVNIKGDESHDIVLKGIEVLNNLTHRGACGCDPRTGDGAGMLLQIPHEFLSRETKKLGFELPARGEYGVGMLFLPLDDDKRKAAEAVVRKCGARGGPHAARMARYSARPGRMRRYRASCDAVVSAGLHRPRRAIADAAALERKLYVIRKRATNEALDSARSSRSGAVLYSAVCPRSRSYIRVS